MKHLQTIALGALLLAGTTLSAKPNMEMNKEALKKMQQMAGEKSPYYRAKSEAFPKDYFLVNQNLPFLVGVALFHPQGDRLKLSPEQMKEIMALKKSTVPAAMKAAKQIKEMEKKLAAGILEEGKSPETLDPLVDKIAAARAALTKAHLRCIAKMRKILSPEQYRTLLELAASK